MRLNNQYYGKTIIFVTGFSNCSSANFYMSNCLCKSEQNCLKAAYKVKNSRSSRCLITTVKNQEIIGAIMKMCVVNAVCVFVTL